MAEQTPETARQAQMRWGVAGAVFCFAGSGLAYAGHGILGGLALTVGLLCCCQAAELNGWRQGWLARERRVGPPPSSGGEGR
ncbi:hypothetical protein [Verrucosispora sp. WMMC514]|uniref:hypothetical protein n=1 Tax=Verrucosispora sp. WMMC514 TaxID=3015156 RepID=UPI00248BC704|nr:hypothetical protein [Verrucosispora sp. WMMC514]WBB94258.1 hypothetical protein O7597_15515 [Verrucosispora sp. WMMC514]